MKKSNVKQGFGILLKYLLRSKKELITIVILGIISAIAGGSVPYLIGRFFDEILSNHSLAVYEYVMPFWLLFLLIWVMVYFANNIISWIIDRKSRRIGTFLEASYLANAYSYLLFLTLSFHKNRKIGDVWNRIYRAAQALDGIQNIAISVTPEVLSVVVGIGIAFFIQPYLAIILMSGLAVYVASLFKMLPPIIGLQRKANRAYERAFGDTHDAVYNIATVKQAGAEEYERKRMKRKFVDIAGRIWYRSDKVWSNVSFFQRMSILLTQFLVFIASVYLIRHGGMTIGELIALNGYAMLIFGPFVRLGYNWQTLQNGFVTIERAEKFLRTKPERYIPKNSISLTAMRGEVEFRDVVFSYKNNEAPVLNDITTTVEPGEIVALVGESGVGKSTFIELISGYYLQNRGRILIDGHDMRCIDLRSLRNNIAVVPQEVLLFDDTVKNNIRYGSFQASDADIEHAAREAYADIFIEKFPKKYSQIVGERGIKLSVGQKQRIAIARAILRDPKILILDEPTSALDARTEKYITRSLKKLMRGRTTFIIAHRLSTVRHADRILVFDKGRIVEEGRHDDLIKKEKGIYRGLYELNIGLQ